MRLALRWAVEENPGSTYLRITSIPCAVPFSLPQGHKLTPGRGTVLRPGTDGVIIAYGPVMLSESFRAAELLAERGRSLAVVSLPWLNRVDSDWLVDTLSGQRRLFLVEDHYSDLGQGAFLTQTLCKSTMAIKTCIYGVDEIPACGQVTEILEYHKLSAGHLAARIWNEI